MNILLIGSGAMEHALARAIRKNGQVKNLYVAKGNAGTAIFAQNLDIEPTNIKALVAAGQELKINLAIFGPEGPLALAGVDAFEKVGIPAFGPNQAAARIETSKVFAKELMQKNGILCAQGKSFTTFSGARDYAYSQPTPIVIKADGLAGGKGVVIAQSKREAVDALRKIMLERVFGPAGDQVVIEECLTGQEVSVLAFTDGETVVPMVPACGYKRRDDGNGGPNTGGMGSYSSSNILSPYQLSVIVENIIAPTLRAMTLEGRRYKGVIYAGLMMTASGPKALEFNCRFGDPETQVILPLLETDLAEILLAVVRGKLSQIKIKWSADACVGAVMASGGYPNGYKTGFPILGLNSVSPETIIYHGGTKHLNSQIVTDGGRVLTVAAKGKTVAEAREQVYGELLGIKFQDCFYRSDIAAGVD